MEKQHQSKEKHRNLRKQEAKNGKAAPIKRKTSKFKKAENAQAETF